MKNLTLKEKIMFTGIGIVFIGILLMMISMVIMHQRIGQIGSLMLALGFLVAMGTVVFDE